MPRRHLFANPTHDVIHDPRLWEAQHIAHRGDDDDADPGARYDLLQNMGEILQDDDRLGS